MHDGDHIEGRDGVLYLYGLVTLLSVSKPIWRRKVRQLMKGKQFGRDWP